MKLAGGQLKADEGLRPGGGSLGQLSANQQLAKGVSVRPSGAAPGVIETFGTNVVVRFAKQPTRLNLNFFTFWNKFT